MATIRKFRMVQTDDIGQVHRRENYRNLWLIAPFDFYLHIFLKIICRKQDSMWQNLITS